ncbi:MAG: translation initiation factor IF-3 [Parcubacteria group bacterium]|nr:translation initiation factor IF-3 [Parcubacteria group bacterium]
MERINNHIRAPELRVIGHDGAVLGVLSREEALARAEAAELDLVEISPNTTPPVAKILDYGKFLYEKSKKEKLAKSKAHIVEMKSLQVTIGTGEHDLALKAKNASSWLKEGHRVRINLFLKGRAKYLNDGFLKERLDRLLHFVTEEFKIVDGPKKGPKGLAVVIEKGAPKAAVKPTQAVTPIIKPV